MNSGGSASYTSGSGTNTLTFTYTVAGGENSADLDYNATTSLVLNGGTIRDAASNDAVLTLATPGAAGSLGANKAIVIDTTAPATPGIPDMQAASDSAINNDDITNVQTPTFDVTCETGATVEVRTIANGLLGSATCVGGVANVTVSSLADGVYLVFARQTDAAGNTSGDSATLSVTIDTVEAVTGTPDLDPASDSGDSDSDDLTNNTSPTINVSCDSGSPATVTLYEGVTVRGTGVCTASPVGIVVNTTLADGAHTFTATQTDIAGNTSALSSSLTITIDTTPSGQTGAPDLITADDSGVDNTDNITSEVSPTFTGTCPVPGETVKIEDTVTSTVYGSAVCDGLGNYSIAVTGPLADGDYTFVTHTTDAAGNQGVDSTSLNVTIDTTSPAAPSITTPADGSSTNDSTPTFSGTAEAGSTVTVVETSPGAGTLCTAVADGSGNWSCVPGTPLADNVYVVHANATDVSGNTGADSGDTTFTVDTVAPNAPVITFPVSGSSINVNQPAFAGTAEPGAVVIVSETSPSNVVLCTGIADGFGNWTCTPVTPLADGPYTVEATATDAATNTSVPSSPATSFIIDTVAPNAPTLDAPTNGAFLNDNTPTFSGTAEPNSTVTVVESSPGSATLCTAVTDGFGNWTCDASPALLDDVYTVHAFATDAAGNDSADSSDVSFTIDTVAPSAPVITTPLNGSSISDPQPAISGTAEAGSFVFVSQTAPSVVLPLCTATANGLGLWTCTPGAPLADDTYTISATATDAAGNSSVASSDVIFTVDTVTPVAPGTPDLVNADDSGTFNNDNVTNVTTPSFDVAPCENGVTVELRSGLTTLGTTTCAGGTATITSSVLIDGTYSITARQIDLAGNTGPDSDALSVTIDTAEAAPGTPDLDQGSDTGTSDSDDLTSNASPVVNIACDSGSPAMVTLFEGATPIGSAECLTSPVAITVSVTLADGPHTITAQQTDRAGNTSALSAGLVITIDTTATVAPGTPVLNPADDTGASNSDGNTSVTTPEVTVSCAEDGDLVEIFDSLTSTLYGSGFCSGGSVTITLNSLADGDYEFVAHEFDAAGNQSSDSGVLLVTIDTTPPPAPAVLTPVAGQFVNDNTPLFSGTAEPGTTVTITESSPSTVVLCTAVVDGGGNWSCSPSTPLADGLYTFHANATDTAGNTSSNSADQSFTVDTGAPAAPVITSPTPGAFLNDNTPAFSGTAEANSTVTVTESSPSVVVLCTTTADGSGAWTCSPSTPLADGPYVAHANATDAASNVSANSTDLGFTIDTAAPAAPTITSPVDGSRTNDTTPTFSGTAEAGSTVTVSETSPSAAIICSGVANGSGIWTCTAGTPLAEATYTFHANAQDAAGNVSGDSADLTLTVDTTAPSAPVISAPAAGALLNVTTPTISGTAEANSTVTVLEGVTTLCTAVTNGSGAWSCVSSVLAQGGHTIVAHATDVAGNTSLDSATRSFSIDSIAPAAPAITAPTNGSTVTTSTPTISGTAEAGATVVVTSGATVLCTTTANGGGAWSCVSTFIAEGSYSIVATATDAAGNTGPASPAVSFTVHTTTPGAPTIQTPTSGQVVETHTPTITGTGQAGSTVKIFEGSTLIGSAVIDGTGHWSVTTTSLPDGAHTITATVTDPFGLTGPATSLSFSIDADDDLDGILNSQDGTDSADGSGIPNYLNPYALASTVISNDINVPTNLFLSSFDGQVVNIGETQNNTTRTIGIRAGYIDSAGAAHGTVDMILGANAKQDLVVNALDAASNSYGTLRLHGFDPATGNPLPPGSFDGLLAIYRQTVPGFTDFDDAYAAPYVGGIAGSVFASYNTNHPGLSLADFLYLVECEAQMTNQETFAVAGRLMIYREDGSVYTDDQGVPGFRKVLGPNQRVDVGVHDIVGQDRKGLLEWVPDAGFENTKVALQVNRYFYLNSDFSITAPNTFGGVVTALGVKGRSGPIYAALDTTPSLLGPTTSIIEASNVLGESDTIRVDIFNAAGALVKTCTGTEGTSQNELGKKGTVHCIADDALNGGVGTARISGTKPGSLYATIVHYSRLSDGSIWSAQALGASDGLGARQTGTFNTYLSNNCHLIIGNAGETAATVDMSKFDSNGNQLGATVAITLQAHQSQRLEPCAGVTANTYGLYAVVPRNHQSRIFGAGSRDQADYTIGTSLRPAPSIL